MTLGPRRHLREIVANAWLQLCAPQSLNPKKAIWALEAVTTKMAAHQYTTWRLSDGRAIDVCKNVARDWRSSTDIH